MSYIMEYIFAMGEGEAAGAPRRPSKKKAPKTCGQRVSNPGPPAARSRPRLPSEPSIPRCGWASQLIYMTRFLDTKLVFFPFPWPFFIFGLGRELQARFLSFGGGSWVPPVPFFVLQRPIAFLFSDFFPCEFGVGKRVEKRVLKSGLVFVLLGVLNLPCGVCGVFVVCESSENL